MLRLTNNAPLMKTPNIQPFPPSFLLLQQEGYLISACLAMGLTALRTAHVHNKGAVYTGLFNLSVGSERLLKAIIIIDHMLNHEFSVPTKKELKGYGHNIVDLYDACERIGVNRSIAVPNRLQLDIVGRDLLSLLSDFARSTRYHNLDALSSAQSGDDPLYRWGHLLLGLFNTDVPKSQRDKTLSRAGAVAAAIDDNSFTLMHGLDQSALSTSEALLLPALHDQASRFAIFRLIKILAPFRKLIGGLSHEGYRPEQPAIPQMQEFLEWLWDDRRHVLRKRKWP
jgi:hypothetical protein